ncbi:macrophage activating glycoprotein, partial [Pseudohyphozyma bogoriensis]
QVNPYAVGRGPQSGYNLCNSTTEGPDSQCQTAIINTIDDFCLWGAPGLTANGTIGDVEAAVVAYCTKSGHGTRIMPAGTITALQFMRTSAYIQVVGLLNQTGLNLAADDTGGELDPHGADQLGNPLGGLVYSTNLDGGDNTTEVQATSWNNFVGSDTFCFKLCYNNVTSPNYCQNIYDLIGCSYNAPAAYTPNLFVACDGDLQDEVGTYTSDGATYTWSQPSSLAADTTLPWTPRVPASSNCVTYQSSDLFPASDLGYQNTASTSAATSAVTTASGAAATSGASSAASSRSGSSSSTATKTSGTTAATSTASAASTSSTTSGSSTLVVSSGFLGLVGLFAMLL